MRGQRQTNGLSQGLIARYLVSDVSALPSQAMHGKVDEHRCSARCPGDHAENCKPLVQALELVSRRLPICFCWHFAGGGFLVMDVYDVSKMSKAPVISPNPP